MQITQALPLTKGMTLCFVGGGGKTSMIFALATELAGQNFSVLVTTTTAIFHPDRGSQPYDQLIIDETMEPFQCPPKAGQIVVAAKSHDPKTNKLKGYTPGTLAEVRKNHSFDFILIEADGSRRLPIKAPAAHEPVIPGWTDMVIGCIGLDCLGNPMNSQTVHRPEHFSAVTNLGSGEIIGPEHLISLVASSQGLFKNTSKNMQKIVLFNKADTRQLVQKGQEMANRIFAKCTGVDDCLVACLLDINNPAVCLLG